VWFVVPEYIFGDPIYSNPECIAYIIAKLTNNGFFVKYLHPNTLYISWDSYVPAYVRTEFKKRTGKTIDATGAVTDAPDEEVPEGADGGGKGLPLPPLASAKARAGDAKQYPQIKEYRPTGNLVYNADIFDKIEKKFN
jgi:hypothetical protein